MAVNDKVLFLRGSQAKLDQIIASSKSPETSTVKNGAFYLTTDSDRLYVGRDSKLALLNQAVIQVKNYDALPSKTTAHLGDFYYLKDENILCTLGISGSDIEPSWIQINQDTNSDTRIESFVISGVTEDTAGYKITYTLTQARYKKNPLTGKLEVDPKDPIDKIEHTITIPYQKFALSTVASATEGQVKFAGDHNDDSIIHFKGSEADLIKVASDGSKNVTITPAKYEIGASKGTVRFTTTKPDKTQVAKNIAFTGDDHILVGRGQTTDTIDITHAKRDGKSSSANSTLNYNGTFTVDTVVVDDAGHVRDKVSTTYTLPAPTKNTDTHYKAGTFDAAPNGNIAYNIQTLEGTATDTFTTTNSPFYYKVHTDDQRGEGAPTKIVYNQGDLDVYSRDVIDEKMRNINAMVYHGTVGTNDVDNDLPTIGVHIGDTYKVSSETYPNIITSRSPKQVTETAHQGDLVIARGTEKDGVITEASLIWDIVPSGDHADTTYEIHGENHAIVLKDKVNTGNTTSVSVSNGSDATLTVSCVGDELSVKHTNVDRAKNVTFTNSATSITPLKSIKTDAAGHVTEIVADSAVSLNSYILNAEDGASANVANVILQGSGSDNAKQVMQVVGGGDITVEGAGKTGGAPGKVTLAHKAYTPQSQSCTEQAGNSFEIISGVTSNSTGHVTGVSKSTITLPASNNFTYSLKPEANLAAIAGGVSVTTHLNSEGGVGSDSIFNLKSGSLALSQNSNNVVVDLEWGTF